MVTDQLDTDILRWFENAEPLWHDAGDWVAGGPLEEPGWYVEPYCSEGCCDPFGPFASANSARQWSRAWAVERASAGGSTPEFLAAAPSVGAFPRRRA